MNIDMQLLTQIIEVRNIIFYHSSSNILHCKLWYVNPTYLFEGGGWIFLPERGLERVLLKVVDLDVGVDVNVDFTTKVTHTYVAFYGRKSTRNSSLHVDVDVTYDWNSFG